MGWRYVAVKNAEGEYGLHEEFPDLQTGDERVYTIYPVTVIAESPKDLAKWLRRAADDVEEVEAIE